MASKLGEIVYVNGKYVDKKDAKISIFDRGFIFGDGIYEVVPIINSNLANKDDFWERFTRSLNEIEIKLNFTKEQVLEIIYNLIRKNNIIEGAVYLEITRGVAPRNFIFLEDLEPTFVSFVYECEILNNLLVKSGIKIISTDDLRWKRRDIKSVSLLAQCIAKTKAYKLGANECVMIENGHITEGGSSSFFIVKDDVLITKPLSNEILLGIRRKTILKIASKLNLKVEERNITLDEAYKADEVFMSAATWVLLPVVQIDDRLINGGKIGKWSKILRDEYVKVIKKEVGLI